MAILFCDGFDHYQVVPFDVLPGGRIVPPHTYGKWDRYASPFTEIAIRPTDGRRGGGCLRLPSLNTWCTKVLPRLGAQGPVWPTLGAGWPSNAVDSIPTPLSTLYVGCALKIGTIGDLSGQDLFALLDADGVVAFRLFVERVSAPDPPDASYPRLRFQAIRPDDPLTETADETRVLATTSGCLQAERWHYVEWGIRLGRAGDIWALIDGEEYGGGVPGWVGVWVDGYQVMDVTVVDLVFGAGGAQELASPASIREVVHELRVGSDLDIGAFSSQDIDLDDVYLADEGPYGNVHIDTDAPHREGFFQTWMPATESEDLPETPHDSKIAERPPQGSTITTTGPIDTFFLYTEQPERMETEGLFVNSGLDGAPVLAVQTCQLVRHVEAGQLVQPVLYDPFTPLTPPQAGDPPGTVILAPAWVPPAAYRYRVQLWEPPASASGIWSYAVLSGCEWGLRTAALALDPLAPEDAPTGDWPPREEP